MLQSLNYSIDKATELLDKLRNLKTIYENDPTCASTKELFESALQALIESSTTLNEYLVAHIAEAQFHRNNLIPTIHRLPYEILVKIIESFMDNSSEDFEDQREPPLFRLAAVCRLWKQIIYRTPSLWSIITSADKESFVSTALIASGASPLDITYMYTHYNGWDDDSFVNLIQPHILRCQALTLEITSAYVLQVLLSRRLPSLKTLRVIFTDPLSQPLEMQLDLIAPNLQRAHIACRIIPIGRPTGLRSLILTDTYPVSPSLADLRAILQASPDLEQLVLAEGTPPTWRTSELSAVDHQSITLPYLKELRLRNYSDDVVTHLLECIQAPSCESFSLYGALDNPSGPMSVASAILRPVSSSRGRLSIQFPTPHGCSSWSADRGEFVHCGTLSEDGVLVPDAYDLTIGIHPSGADATLRAITDRLFPTLVDAKISMNVTNCGALDITEMESWRALAPHVEELSLSPPGGLPNVITYMSRRDATGEWPFATLKKLAIRGDWSQYQNEIGEMVRSRYGADASQSGDQLPKRLEMLTLHRHLGGGEFWATLRATVGVEHVNVVEG